MNNFISFKLKSGKVLGALIDMQNIDPPQVQIGMTPAPLVDADGSVEIKPFLYSARSLNYAWGYFSSGGALTGTPKNGINDLGVTHYEYLDALIKAKAEEDAVTGTDDAVAVNENCPANTSLNSEKSICEIDDGYFSLEACNLDSNEMGMKYIRYGTVDQLLNTNAPAGTDQINELNFNDETITVMTKTDFDAADYFAGYVAPSIRMYHDATNQKMHYSYTEKLAATKVQNMIYINNDIYLTMICEYDLGEQEVTENINVASKKIASNLHQTGIIPYTLTPAAGATFSVGSPTTFEITPLNPDLYFVKLLDCTVYDAADATRSFQVYPSCPAVLNVNQPLTDPVQTKITIEFMMFKFSNTDATESQDLKCKIDVQYVKQATDMTAC